MHLSVFGTSPFGGLNEIDEGGLSLLPGTGLQAAIRVDEEMIVWKNLEHSCQTVLDLLLARNTRGVDVVNAGTNLVGIAIMLEGIQKLHVTLRGLDRNDISIQALDGWENIVKVGVTEMRMGLELVGNTGGSQFEGINSPFEICIPVASAKR